MNKIGIVGLGVMGSNLAKNFIDKGENISVYNRQLTNIEVDIAQKFAEENPGSDGFDDLSLFAASLEIPRKILIMVNAGRAVDIVIEKITPLLSPGDILMDGGNSHYLDTKRRSIALKDKGINFIGIGVSGGEEGARKGPSIMPGGDQQAFKQVFGLLKLIAAKDKNQNPCCTYIGPEGAGHFVKMVHNGIEYAEMQILAELYHVMRKLLKYDPEKISGIFKSWLKDGESSFLLEITADILLKKEGDDLILDSILDVAQQKGTGGWTIEAALALGVPVNTIADAVSARGISSMKKTRIEAHRLYKDSLKENSMVEIPKSILKNAFTASRIINHAVGFNMMHEASVQYLWNLDLSEIARIWTNGCIIRSELMEKMSEYLKTESRLILNPAMSGELKSSWKDLAHLVSLGLQNGLALPVLSSAANYFLGYITADSPANLIQAQRDFFGAHTYQRTDNIDGTFFHTNWKL